MSQGGMCVYDFDETLAAADVYLATQQMLDVSGYEDDFFVDVFGGEQRLARLEWHFERLQSAGVELAIVSFGWRTVVREALKRTGLQDWFAEEMIFGSDSPLMNEKLGIKGELIRELMASRQIGFEQVIFVDDNLENISYCEQARICRTLHVNHSGGINECDFKTIEGYF